MSKDTTPKKTAKKAAPKKAASEKTASAPKKIRVTQIASGNGQKPGQQATLVGLGLNKIRKSREFSATPEILGMVKKIAHLLKVEELA
jgi:large subunit ribosomal protein L30